jgi:hypothetical protein
MWLPFTETGTVDAKRTKLIKKGIMTPLPFSAVCMPSKNLREKYCPHPGLGICYLFSSQLYISYHAHLFWESAKERERQSERYDKKLP